MTSEKGKGEKSKMVAQLKYVPKDVQVVMSILNELNISNFESRVVNQLLEFAYRYVTTVLDDAKVFANHARKKVIDVDDCQLATSVVEDSSFTGPPARHVLAKLAEVRNGMPLQPVRTHCGLRLPPDRYCLSACNYKLRAATQLKRMTKSAFENRSNLKTQVKSAAGKNTVLQRTITPAKNTTVTIPKPVIKFTATSKSTSKEKTVQSAEETTAKTTSEPIVISSSPPAATETTSVSVGSKRDREDDDYEEIPEKI